MGFFCACPISLLCNLLHFEIGPFHSYPNVCTLLNDTVRFRAKIDTLLLFTSEHMTTQSQTALGRVWSCGIRGGKSHACLLLTQRGSAVFRLQVNMIHHHQRRGYYGSFCPERALPAIFLTLRNSSCLCTPVI